MWQIVAGVLSAISTFSQLEAQRSQLEYQSKVAESNAIAKRQQAEITRKQTENEQRAKDVEAERLSREYRAAAGTNRSLLAAGNVDITTGSAMDLLEGNANRYAADLGEMEFQKAMIGWSGNREADVQEWEADNYDAQASYLDEAAGTMFGSLLGAGMSGFNTYGSLGGFNSGGASTTGMTKLRPITPGYGR